MLPLKPFTTGCVTDDVIYVWIIITIVTVIVQVIYCSSVMALGQRSIMAINNWLVEIFCAVLHEKILLVSSADLFIFAN